MLLQRYFSIVWKPVYVIGNILGFGRCVSTALSHSTQLSLIISSAGGGSRSFRWWQLRPPSIGVWARDVLSVCWPKYTTQKCVGLYNFIAPFTHLALVLLSKIGVTLWKCRPPSPVGPSWQPQSSRIFQLGSGSPAIAAFTSDKMVVPTIDTTIRSIDSSSPGQCHQNRWVLVAPTLFPAMSGSTLAMVYRNGSTGKLVKALQRGFTRED